MFLTTHQLAKILKEGPDVPVTVHKNVDIFAADIVMQRISADGKRVLFTSDKEESGEKKTKVFSLQGSASI